MKTKRLLYGFITAVCLFTVFDISGQSNQQEISNYITISGGQFKDGDSVFKPLCINYLVNCAKCMNTGEYYIAPHFNYSDTYVSHRLTEIDDTIYPNGHYGYGTNGIIEMNNAKAKLEHDLKIIDSLGFNVVRIPPAIYWKNDVLYIPTGSYAKYFELTDTLIAKCARHNLRVILVLSDETNTYKQFDQYCVYLDSVTRHYSGNKTVMAYVVYMEPEHKWQTTPDKNNDKLLISNWSRKWYYLIKKNAPNQLVTYGLGDPNGVLFWDPSALTYDFLSMHYYHNSSDPDSSIMAVACYFKWMNDNMEDVWVLGETGFSGTNDSCKVVPNVGSDTAQYHYADITMQKSLECGCRGYSWWQYQEVMWGSCRSNHFGIVKHYPHEQYKMVHSLFPLYRYRNLGVRCLRPNRYYNIPGYSHPTIQGVVKDDSSNPIKDAVVRAWSSTYKTSYSTFTDNQGRYTVYAPQDTVLVEARISHYGYTDIKFFPNPLIPDTTKLIHINYNKWKKNWTNINYPVVENSPNINTSDTIIVGNFFGDEAQELLVVKFTLGSASLYRFHTNHWELVWANGIGDWQISSTDKYYVGDYDGDGNDELLCIQNTSNPWVNIYRYNPQYPNNPWQYVWTNSGNGKIGNWSYAPGNVILSGYFSDSTYSSLICIRDNFRPTAICQRLVSSSWETIWNSNFPIHPRDTTAGSIIGFDKYYVGDFNGDGIDELFCVQSTEGYSDWMKLLQYDSSWNILWSNYGQPDSASIYPYRANLHVGDFDKDRADEILGVNTWATKFDFNSSNQWDWSWSTYNSKKLSDWLVSPDHLIFFLKTTTDVPDYLFIGRWYPHMFRFNAYSFDP